MSFLAKMLWKYKDDLKYPPKYMKHQNLPIQNMTGRAVMEEFD